MPERPNLDPEPQHSGTRDPRDPPDSVVSARVRRSAVRTYVGGIVAVFVVVAAVYAYWAFSGRGGPDPELDLQQPSTIGTAGRDDPFGPSPGGFDPVPRKDTTQDELEFRGEGNLPQPGDAASASTAPLTGLDAVTRDPRAMAGRRVDLRDMEVERVDGGTFVIREGDARATVIAPAGAPAMRTGDRVNVSGTVEADASGQARIRAEGVNVR